VPDAWSDLRVALLGQLVGDGSYLVGQPLRYTTSSEENSEVVSAAAQEEFGCAVTRYAGRRGWRDRVRRRVTHFRFAPSRAHLLEYAELLDDEVLRSRATADLFWDRIVAIEPDGEDEVFDLTVPGPASWLADGIVSHNSGALEQDADLILFLYRPSIYKEDLPPDEANLTEVIIGKQRNGPVGTVKVVFLPQYARFENVAELHRQPQPF
jgi:hypothetical protein